ncbi:hypothetical protein L6164_034674 [Bauhinia variegata]|uniref:Uncharacterized protein n=1 Tax=Bauhinia variegata TaxID=167791 RepID=A0ACB9KVH8_BAUVA|nr:hypothetical protein L6164_034674 [Bauhinia variegata]
MASQGELKQRLRNDSDANNKSTTGTDVRPRRDKKMAMAKRGLRSLVIAATLPLSLSLLTAYLASSHSKHDQHAGTVTSRKLFWFLPTWALHLTCPASSLLMGLSAWLVWADGGFHRNPTALGLYLAQLALTLLWDPILFGAGATKAGLMVCLGILGTQVGCLRVFKRTSVVAGDLIMPCLAWTAFLCVVNLKLVFV